MKTQDPCTQCGRTLLEQTQNPCKDITCYRQFLDHLIEISSDEAATLKDTHSIFWDSNILADTLKAFRIKIFNSKGALSSNWVPKSKVKVLLVDVPGQAEKRKKYYVPKFFIK